LTAACTPDAKGSRETVSPEAIERLSKGHARLSQRANTLYEDRLDGRIDLPFCDLKSRELRETQTRIHQEIEQHQKAEQSYTELRIRILELSARLYKLFCKKRSSVAAIIALSESRATRTKLGFERRGPEVLVLYRKRSGRPGLEALATLWPERF
jgi:hypothetical protein